MKNAKVIPIAGSKSEPSNYRPISLLSCLSKVMEKLIYYILINYLNKNLILHHNRYGFRSDLSTSHALFDVVTTRGGVLEDVLGLEVVLEDTF